MTTKQAHGLQKVSYLLFVFVILISSFALSSIPVQAGELYAIDAAPTTKILAAPAACNVPRTRVIRGKNVTFDQCYQEVFHHNGTDYGVDVYYTEIDSEENLSQCSDEEGEDRCVHSLFDTDDGNGNNANVVVLAQETVNAIRFYHDQDLNFLPDGNTTVNVYVANDPHVSGFIDGDGIYIDHDKVEEGQLWKRLLAFYEMHHLVQTQYDDLAGLQPFYSNGIARAVEDRFDPDLDGASLGYPFTYSVNQVLSLEENRLRDIATRGNGSVLWWTWLMDQYRSDADVDPVIGWDALRDFYLELKTEADQLTALNNFINSRGSSFADDFIDYTLALYTYRFNPADERLGFLDEEITNNDSMLQGHHIITDSPAFAVENEAMNPRSSQYWEYIPGSQCDYISFTFDGNGDTYGFSIVTVDDGTVQDRWTSQSTSWSRTIRSSDLDQVMAVVTALDSADEVSVGHGCVTPTIDIKSPTTNVPAEVGLADNARKFIVRLDVDGADGTSVPGLTANDFQIEISREDNPPVLADILNATYVQDDYWLLVQAPNEIELDDSENGRRYDLTVLLLDIFGIETDTEVRAVSYSERAAQDVVIVLDRSGSMGGDTGKIEAARNAANLMVNELAENDYGAFVAFDGDAALQLGLNEVGVDDHRTNLEDAIAVEVAGGSTSIGDGLFTAAQEHDANGNPENACSFVLLSDGHENQPQYWADVEADVTDNHCVIHTVALGPGTNEPLMQQIAGSVNGGSYDYATTTNVPPLARAADVTELSWENNLSRIYDAKATHLAGRQRIFSGVGGKSAVEEFLFHVDDQSDTLVLALAWQLDNKGAHSVILTDPNGNVVDAGFRRLSPYGTNEVWTVPKPVEGLWKMVVSNLTQEYYVSATALTDYEIYLFVGTPIENRTQGVQVPIFASFVGPNKPLTDAEITAVVQAPDGSKRTLRLYDDGNHNDSDKSDGVYGNIYTATSLADLVEADPDKVKEGSEPSQSGSYIVDVTAVLGDIRREIQDSFVITLGQDDDYDHIPNYWEDLHGLDSKFADDALLDSDGDGLLNI